MTDTPAPKPTGKLTLYLVRGIIVLMGVFVLISVVRSLMVRSAGPSPALVQQMLGAADRYEVRIKRDTYGVPHIFGPRDADVAFGLGFAHAEDDFITIQETALTSRGDLAAVVGKSGAVTDYLARVLRVKETVDEGYDTLPAAGARNHGQSTGEG